MRTTRKISILVLLLTTIVWSLVPTGLVFAAENSAVENLLPEVVQLETPSDILPEIGELVPETNPDQLTPVTPITPIKPIKPIDEQLIPEEFTPVDHKSVPGEDEREPRNPLDEENPLDSSAKRDNAGLQPKNNGEYSVDEFTGVFSYNYPLQIPAGRNGLQPSASLQYNHRLNNIGSMVGVGWQLTMPSVERANRTGIDNLYTDNYFRLNLGGSDDLVPINIDGSGYGVYGKQIESDFLKIEFNSSNKWIVTDKLGVIYTFGENASSRQDNPANSSQVYKWLLEEVRDTNDNFIRYEYYKDSGQIYPKKIFYTGHGTTDGIFEVDFEPFANGTPTENNVDAISYQTGFGVETKYLLDSIDVKINGQLITRYDLDLNLNANSNKYLLNSITPKFYQDGAESVKDEVEFDYSESVNSYREGTGYDLPYALGATAGSFNNKQDLFIDLDGDSYNDHIRLFCTNGTVSVNVWKNAANGHWTTSTDYSISQIETGITCRGIGTTVYSIPVSFGNMNGDHFIDMITDDTTYYNTGSSWQSSSTTLPVSLYNSSNQTTPPMPKVMFQDMNTDGYDDIVYVHHPNNHQSDIDVYIKDQVNGTWNLDNNFHLSVDQQHPQCLVEGGSPFDFKDFNNDGLLDVFYKYYCRYGYEQPILQGEQVYLNSGYNFTTTTLYSAPVLMSYYNVGATASSHVDYFTDLNNDGAQDYGIFNKSLWNTGSEWVASGALTLMNQEVFRTDWVYPQYYYTGPLPVAIVDINGDQIQDAIHNPSNTDFHIYYGQGIKSDILTQANYQSGAKVNVYYDSSAKEKNEQGNLLNPDLPFDLQVVKEVVVNNGQQDWQGYQYEYEDGSSISYLDQNIKDVYGFAKVEKKLGQAMPDIDFGTGVDGAYVSSGNEAWNTDKNFTSLTIQSGHTITVTPEAKIKVQGNVIINGVLTAQGQGYTGGEQVPWGGEVGDGPGGGGGAYGGVPGVSTAGGGGAGYAEVGENGQGCQSGYCSGGMIYGNELLEGIDKGSGGGGSGGDHGATGGDGGGIIQIFSRSIIINGEVDADGDAGENGQSVGNFYYGGAGGGSGGSIYLKALESVEINGVVHANGGQGGHGGYNNDGGDGANGRIRIESPQINGTTNPVYYSRGDFDYSIDNTPVDNNLQKTVNYYHTAADDDLHLHGKPKMTEKYDAGDNLIGKSFISWQEEDLNNNRKFVYNNQSSNTAIHLLESAEPIEMDIDANTLALYHMDGLVGSAEKQDNAQGNPNYDLVEQPGSVASSDGFNGEVDGAYRSPGGQVWINTNIDNLGGEPFTIEFWLKFNSSDTNGKPFGKKTENDYGFYAENSNNLSVWQSTSDLYNWTATTTLAIAPYQWHYFAYSTDLDNAYMYYDGDLIAQANVVEEANPLRIKDLILLCIKEGCSNSPQISMDEVRVSNIARSTSEIFNYFHNTQEPYFETHTAKQSTYDLANGNLLTENDLGKVELNINTGQITNQLIGDEKETVHEYAFNTAEHILAAPKTKIISDANDSKQQNLYYDNLPLGQVDHVNLTKEDYIVNQVDIDRTFNSYGLVTTQTDPRGYNTTLTYDSHNLYPYQTTNPLNQISYAQYNLFNGQVATSTSANGLVTVNKYDAFGRPTETKISNPDNPSQLISKQKFIYQDNNIPRYTEGRNYFNINSYQTSREYYNGLDQVIQKKSQTAVANEWSTVDMGYDSLGRVIRQSLPYITNTLEYTEADLQAMAKTYTYDALDRILTEITPVGTTTYEYDGLTTKIYDANNHRKDLTKDAYGNLIEVKEYNDAEIYITNYEYNLSNQLTKIIDALGNERNFTYDDLGNLISQDMVHVSGAQNVPIMSYVYDKNGNILSKTSFNGAVIGFTYDKLNRVASEKVSGKYNISYFYDQGAQANRGQLTRVNYSGGNYQVYNYDILGQPINYTAYLEGQNYAFDYDHNLAGQLMEVYYPGGKQVNYNLNPVGQVNEVIYDNGQTQTTIADDITYNINGQLSGFTRSNGYFTNYTYDPDQNFRLINLATADGQNILQDTSYVYDPVGNITQLFDAGQADLAKTVTYTYDDLNRLLSADADYTNSTTSDYAIDYEYDAVGNMTYNSELGVLDYDYDQPHQVSEANNIAYTYDNAGNLLDNETIAFTWDARNRLISSVGASDYPTSYQYDSNNQRLVKKTYKPGTPIITLANTHYANEYYEKDTLANNTKSHVYLGNIKLATVNNNDNPYFIVGDHLNSSSILINNTGQISEMTDYQPYGKINYENTVQNLDNDYTFTGQEYDDESGLQYFGARYMDNNVGKFISIDPATLVLGDIGQFKNSYGLTLQEYLADPQNLNSYTYGRNNPIILVDPDGQSWQTFGQGVASPFVYAYHNPGKALVTLAVGAAVVAAAPVAAAVAGAALGGIAIGSAVGNAMNAPDADTRDYYLGQGLTATALTALGIKSAGALSKAAPTGELPNSAFVCRGGTCDASKFEFGNGAPLVDGKLTDVSVQSAAGTTVNQLLKNLLNKQAGATTVGQIRKLGGDVISSPNSQNSYHATLRGITPEQAQNLFQPTIRNPWR